MDSLTVFIPIDVVIMYWIGSVWMSLFEVVWIYKIHIIASITLMIVMGEAAFMIHERRDVMAKSEKLLTCVWQMCEPEDGALERFRLMVKTRAMRTDLIQLAERCSRQEIKIHLEENDKISGLQITLDVQKSDASDRDPNRLEMYEERNGWAASISM